MKNHQNLLTKIVHGRASNPTVAILEKKIAALEHGSRAVVFSAGMAACAAAILRVCTAGSNVICIKESYGPVQHLLDEFLGPKYNVSVTYVDGRTVKEFEDAIRPEYIKRGLESKNLSRSLEEQYYRRRAAGTVVTGRCIYDICTWCTDCSVCSVGSSLLHRCILCNSLGIHGIRNQKDHKRFSGIRRVSSVIRKISRGIIPV